MSKQNIFFLPFLLLLLLFTACNKKNQEAKPMPESAKAYIFGFTDGIISRVSPVQIQFSGVVAELEQVGKSPENGLISISPSVKGTWTWKDRQSLYFEADEPLEPSTSYLVTVQLADLYDNVPKEAQEFEFSFTTRDPFIRLSVDGLNTPDLDVREKQELKGQLKTADFIGADHYDKLLHVTQKGKTLAVEWSHNDEGTIHYFTISGIKRGKEPGELILNWNGKDIDAQQSGTEKIEIPAIGDFKVLGVETVGGAEAQVNIHFSDPLKTSQAFDGLVNVTNTNNNFRYVTDGHLLKVYLNQPLSGTQTVSIFTGIKNRYNEKLSKTGLWEVGFTTIEPQIRMLGHGNILPSSSGLVLPFEAIGLHAVEVEVFKIYHNNILQFLQNNSLDGRDELHRVGKVEIRKNVPLSGVSPGRNQAEWNRYALDLRQFFDVDPKAIYQIRIGFKREDSLYPCKNEQDFTFGGGYSWQNETPTLLDSWYGLEGYYQEFSWDDRDDPCFPAYYNADRFVVRNVLSSNLGILAKGNEQHEYVFIVNDLRTTKAVVGANLTIYNYQQQILGNISTDGEGKARIKLDEQAFVVVAESADDQGYLRLDEGEALNLSRFDIAGQAPQDGLKGFIYGERGVWRPGDSIFLNFILEDEQVLLPPDYPISYELRDAQGQLREKGSGIEPKGTIYPLYFKTGIDDPTGNWRIKVMVGTAAFTKNIKVEAIKPNRIKLALEFASDPIKASSGKAYGKIQANWLHGAAASYLKANLETTFKVNRAGFPKFKDYIFLDREKTMHSSSTVVFDDYLDEDGAADFTIPLPGQIAAPGPIKATVRSRVFEKSGDFSTQRKTVDIHPYDRYAGLLIPKNRYGSPQLTLGENATVELASADLEGNAVAGTKLNIELYRVQWRWWWDEDGRGSRYNRDRSLKSILNESKTTNANGRASVGITLEKWGRYLVRVCDAETGHCASSYVYAGSPWYSEGTYSDEASMLTFQSAKESYEVGEEVEINFPAGEGGRALLSLENGLGVMQTYWIDTKAGDNSYRFKATSAMAPTVYASLTVLQPHAQKGNDLPIRSYGVIPITVTDAETILNPEIKMPEELKPEKTFALEVREANGKPMTYTIAIVDEGLLSLTNFKTPNPHASFYAREALGVRTWDVYSSVLDANGADMGQILSIGGDAEISPAEEGDRANRFKPVVIHLGPFELAQNQKATHKITLPNYIGAVRTMVVAASHKAYGSVEKSVPVRKPLMVLATLPRVLGIGESLDLPVNVFAMKDGIGTVNVRLEESSGLVNIATSKKQLSFRKSGDKILRFPIRTGNGTGVAKFKIIAEGGGESTSQEIEIDIRNPNPMQTLTESFVLAVGEEKTLSYVPFGTAGTRSGLLEMTNLPPIDLDRHLHYLIHYPYGCLEQTLSSGFPQLHLADFIKLDKKKEEEMVENVQATLERLRRFQLPNGGFAYWPGNTDVASWSTNYAGHFLLAAKAKGYVLPAGMLEDWIDFQKKSARKWDAGLSDLGHVRRSSYELDQAYRLYTLALAGKAQMGAMNRLKELPKLGVTARWRLGAAYALAGQKEVASNLINSLPYSVEDYRELSYTYGSAVRDKAMILETLILIDKDKAAAETALLLSKDLSSGRWLSTHEIAYSLLAFSQFIGSQEEQRKDYTFTIQQNGSKAVDAGADHPYMQIALADKQGQVRIKNTSKQKLFGTIVRQGQPLPEEEVATSSFMKLNVNYYDSKGNDIDVENLKQGTDFVAEVRLNHTLALAYNFDELALEQIFPAGWEITNTRFENMEAKDESRYDYRDFRDDRVLTFFDMYRNKTYTYKVYLTAAYPGKYYLPATKCEAMYDNKIYASSPGYWVNVLGVDVGD